MAVFK